MTRLSLIGLAALACAAAAPASAKVTAAEADRLGKDLTCVGAEKAGNKDGSIPEFSGKWLGTPPGIQYTPNVGQHPVDPYKDDKPLFTITAQNQAQYADKLTDGQKAMLAKYPQTFRLPVYQSRRDFRYPDFVCASAKKNATSAELGDRGLSVKGAVNGAVPFPIPKDGLEVLWNHTLPYRAFSDVAIRDNANVLSNGTIAWGRVRNMGYTPIYEQKAVGKPVEGVQAWNMSFTLLPERDKGTVSISQEPLDFGKEKRLAWNYDPGTRRVRQLPEFGFDQPAGLHRRQDDDRLRPPLQRHARALQLEARRQARDAYIPANAYKVHAKGVKYPDLLKPGHPNPDFSATSCVASGWSKAR
jgi:hypothetical protein